VPRRTVLRTALKDCLSSMKTDIKNLAAFLATSIWADGEYDEAEKIAISEIAEAMELKKDEL
jgi:tellurite resistance protein